MKYFQSEEARRFREEMSREFRQVYNVKPGASRSESSENYWVCKDFGG